MLVALLIVKNMENANIVNKPMTNLTTTLLFTKIVSELREEIKKDHQKTLAVLDTYKLIFEWQSLAMDGTVTDQRSFEMIERLRKD